jgi:hypothetical protein
MKRACLFLVAGAGLSAASACNLVDSSGVHVGYSFDVQKFSENAGGDPMHPTLLPVVACAPGQTPDPCAQAQSQMSTMLGTAMLSCSSGACQATATFVLPQTIDLRMANTPLPSEAVQYGISAVAIDRIDYFISKNTLDVATPPIQIFVGSDTARTNLADPSVVQLGSVAPIPAGSTACGDPVDPKGDPMAMAGQTVCDIPLTNAGQSALSAFVQNYKNAPFEIVVDATVTAPGGSNIPAGELDLNVRPSVTLSILK